MNYNDGAVKDVTQIEDKRKAAHDFAEGNIYLEELLNNCYDNGIITKACCAGHDKNTFTPYIVFYLSKENENYINAIMTLLINRGWSFKFSKIKEENYPTFYIKCPNDYDYNEFFIELNDILNISKNMEFSRLDLDKHVSLIYDALLSIDEGDFGISINNNKKTIIASLKNLYEVISYDEPLLSNYFDYIIRFNIKEFQKNREMKSYNSNKKQQFEQDRFQQFLKDNNIKLKDDKEIDVITKYGGYSNYLPIQCEVVVDENDSIYTTADKLNKLVKFENIGAKAVVCGFDILNNEKKASNVLNGRQLYENSFTMHDCVSSYEKMILNNLNKLYFNNELVLYEDSPLAIITFNNDNLTEEELSRRISLIKEYKLDVILRYKNINMGFGILNNNKKQDKLSLNNDILYCMLGTDNITEFNKLMNILIYVNSNDNIEKNVEMFHNCMSYNDELYTKRIGIIEALNDNYLLLNQCVRDNKIIPFLEYLKSLDNENDYIDIIINKLNYIETIDELVAVLIEFYNNYNKVQEVSIAK